MNNDSNNETNKSSVPSFAKLVWREIYRSKMALLAFFIFVVTTLTVFIWAGFFINVAEATRMNLGTMNQAPSDRFILGTDDAGRSIVDMLVLGARNSMAITFGMTFITFIVGALIGVFTGFYGGKIDNIIMRFVDIMSMMPTLMVLIALLQIVTNRTIWQFIMITSIFGWIGTTRVVRTRALQQGMLEYVHASKTLGTPNLVIIFREVMPNLVSILSGNFIFLLAANMGLETGLTIIGFGLPFEVPSLGRLVTVALNPAFMQNRPWQWAPALIFIIVMTLSIVFVGQAVNRAADARQRSV